MKKSELKQLIKEVLSEYYYSNIIDLDGIREEDPVPATVDKKYDRQTRSWVVQLKDKWGNQIGDAAKFYLQAEADNQKNNWREEFNIL